VLPLFDDVAKPIAQAPPSKTRPTWKAATIVEPFANVSGSTSVWWFVVVDALHVACVNGSVLICAVAADTAAATASDAPAPMHAATSARRRRPEIPAIRSSLVRGPRTQIRKGARRARS
jgi:hypothetical protein